MATQRSSSILVKVGVAVVFVSILMLQMGAAFQKAYLSYQHVRRDSNLAHPAALTKAGKTLMSRVPVGALAEH